jgi:hypothetical protein
VSHTACFRWRDESGSGLGRPIPEEKSGWGESPENETRAGRESAGELRETKQLDVAAR